MADKEQIIIHGIDVSKCKFYRPGSFPTDCEINPVNAYCESPTSSNCYFKQLARKTQEFEQLQEKYEALKLENEEGYEIVDELKHECEELKEEIGALEKINRRNDQELLRRLTYASNAEKQRDRYRQALDEIEEIAKFFNKNELCFIKEINECDCCDMGADCNYLRRAKILYIINKAKGDNK